MKNINVDFINNEIDIKKNSTIEKQDNALIKILDNVINWSVDAGLRYILPDSIENEIIKIKNDFINGNAAKEILNNIKSVINIENKKLNFDDIQNLLRNPNTIKLLTNTVNNILNNENKINYNENITLKNVENNLTNELENQIKSINKINNYKNEWYKNFENKDLKEMDKIFKKIKNEFKKVIPLENTIKEIRKIENLNELIKSKGGDFNLTKEEQELVNRLV